MNLQEIVVNVIELPLNVHLSLSSQCKTIQAQSMSDLPVGRQVLASMGAAVPILLLYMNRPSVKSILYFIFWGKELGDIHWIIVCFYSSRLNPYSSTIFRALMQVRLFGLCVAYPTFITKK